MRSKDAVYVRLPVWERFKDVRHFNRSIKELVIVLGKEVHVIEVRKIMKRLGYHFLIYLVNVKMRILVALRIRQPNDVVAVYLGVRYIHVY